MVQIDSAFITAVFAGIAVVVVAVGKILLDLRKIHLVVNSRLTDALTRIENLRDKIQLITGVAEKAGQYVVLQPIPEEPAKPEVVLNPSTGKWEIKVPTD